MDINNLDTSFTLFGIIFIIAFIFFTVRRKSLTLSGAVTAAIMGIWVVYFAGAEWLTPLFFFFISGTLLGKLNAKTELTTDEKHGKGRDAWQVICNGFPYAFLATFLNKEPFFELTFGLMFVSISIAVADTWSSEIGMFFKGKTVDILKFKKQKPGVSGGISLAGSIGGLVGAFCSASICIFMAFRTLDLDAIPLAAILIGVITLAGFGGMLLDSILGSAFQLKYKNSKTGEFSDVTSAENTIQKGIPWMTNDVVNLVSNLVGTGFFALLLYTFREL